MNEYKKIRVANGINLGLKKRPITDTKIRIKFFGIDSKRDSFLNSLLIIIDVIGRHNISGLR